MLDVAAMHRWIGFNHQNQWHFKTPDHPYRFAFADLRLMPTGSCTRPATNGRSEARGARPGQWRLSLPAVGFVALAAVFAGEPGVGCGGAEDGSAALSRRLIRVCGRR